MSDVPLPVTLRTSSDPQATAVVGRAVSRAAEGRAEPSVAEDERDSPVRRYPQLGGDPSAQPRCGSRPRLLRSRGEQGAARANPPPRPGCCPRSTTRSRFICPVPQKRCCQTHLVCTHCN